MTYPTMDDLWHTNSVQAKCIAETERREREAIADCMRMSERVSQLERILGWFMPDEINGYNFDHLLEKSIEGLKTLGGWQNCYAIRAIHAARENARQELRSSPAVQKAVQRFHSKLAEREKSRQVFKKEDHACSTGDCQHEKQSECDDAMARLFPEQDIQRIR